MEKSKYFLLATAMLTLASCFSDEGNYDYDAPLVINVEGIEKSYSVSPTGDILQINPVIKPAGRDYDCFWTVTSASATWGDKVDTISRSQNLEYKINLDMGAYKLRFNAKDRLTGVFSYTEYDLSVTTDMETGWWILKTIDGNTDIDFFSNEKAKPDVIMNANGQRLNGEALNVDYTSNFWKFNADKQTDERVSAVFVASKGDIAALDYFTGRIISNYNQLFVEAPAKHEVRGMFKGPSDTHVYVDGHIYTMYHSKYSIYNQFVIKALGDYDIAPQHHAAGSLPLLFNRANSSFCSVSRTSSTIDYFKNSSPSPIQMNMDLEYIGGKTTASWTQGDMALALMKGKTDGKHYLLQLDGQPYTMDYNPIWDVKEMPADLGLYKAEHRALNQNNNIVDYAIGNVIYSCNLDNWEEAKADVTLADGEEITYMEYLKYAPYGYNETWFDYLVIATSKGDSYKLCLHPVAAGRIQPAQKTLEGKGKVQRACYMRQEDGYVYTSTLF